MKLVKNNRGFTLIELLLVVGIVAVILAVIVPMGLRARIDAKYGVVRQNCSELAGFASQWVEKSIQAQDEQSSTATVKDYYASLAGAPEAPTGGNLPGQWIAVQGGNNNWNLGADGLVASRSTTPINGRYMDGAADVAPEDCVEDIIPPDKTVRNPFTEVNVFRDPNDPDTQGGAITGAVALGGAAEAVAGGGGGGNPWIYYAFGFQGTDSTTNTLTGVDTTFHAGMRIDTVAGLRNGVFLGRFR